jgi:catechol 2,3-dioxygenase-like lactoylglutathione lyase family enzyme
MLFADVPAWRKRPTTGRTDNVRRRLAAIASDWRGVRSRRVAALTETQEQDMIHHIDFTVSNLMRSRDFYTAALAPLGMHPLMHIQHDDGREVIGFGVLPDPVFWIRRGTPITGHLHIAFAAGARAAVDAFHAAALAAGGDHYYAAFVLDPDGHNIEAVCRNPR